MSSSEPRTVALRVFRTVVEIFALAWTFVTCLVAGLLLHLDLPGARRVALRELTAILSPQFVGRVAVERLGELSVFGVAGVNASVTAPDGTRVLVAKGVSARIAPLALVRSALFGKGDVRLRVASIALDAVEVNLDGEPDGSLKLVHAFDPRTPSPPPAPGARGVAVDLPSVALRHAWIHGVLAGAPPIDADLDAVQAAFLSSSEVTDLTVPRLELAVRGLPDGVSLHGAIRGARLAIPSDAGKNTEVGAVFDGGVGEIPIVATFGLDGEKLDAVLDVPEVSAAAVRSSVEGAPVYRVVSAHGEAHGDLSDVKTTLRAKLGHGSIDLDGDVVAKGAFGARVTVEARGIDARTFVEDGPATDVGAKVVASVETRSDKALAGRARIDVPVGTVAGQRLPHATFTLEAVQRPGANGATTTGHLEGTVDEPGAPFALTVDGSSRGGVSTVTFGGKLDVPSLADVKRIPGLGEGKADVVLEGRVELDRRTTFDARVDAHVDGFERRGMKVKQLALRATGKGSLAAPDIDARAFLQDVSAFGYRFSRLDVAVLGNLANVRVAASGHGTDSLDVTAKGEVALGGHIGVRDVALGLRRGRKGITVRVASVRVEDGTVAVSGAVLEGAGAPLRMSFRSAPGSFVADAKSDGLDLDTLADLAGQKDRLGGRVALDVAVDARRDSAKGRVALDLTDGRWTSVRGAVAHANLNLEGRRLRGDLALALGDVGALRLHDVDLHLGGEGPLSVASWREAWGRAAVSGAVDLARVAAIAPAGSFHMADVAGHVIVEGHVARDSLADATPEIQLHVRTEGLAASGEASPPVREPGGPLMTGPPTWTLKGMDFGADLAVNGEDASAEFAFRAIDKLGGLVAVDVKTASLPFDAVLGNTGRGSFLERLEELPVSVLVDVPRREIDQLPLLLRPEGVKGEVEATLAMHGSIRDPRVSASAQSHGLTFAAVPRTPIEGGMTADYDGSNGRVDISLRSPKDVLLKAGVNVQADAKSLLAGAPFRWKGSANATLAHFPLGAVAMLSDDQVRGVASGEVSLTGLREHARAKMDLSFDDLEMGKAKFSKGRVAVTIDDAGLDAKARLEGAHGFAEADAKMGMKWGAELAPASDGTGVRATVRAKHFPAEAMAPFLSSAISKLSGWIDAEAQVSAAPGRKPEMSGSVAFTDGVVQAPAIGEEFHDMTAKVSLAPDGTVKLAGVEARGLSGKLSASGSAHLDAMNLRDASVALTIRKGDGIPLDIQGSNLGSVYGAVTVKAAGAPDGKAIRLAVDVPSFHVDLPAASFPRSPQTLADAPSVHMGVYRDPDRFVVLPMDDAPVKLVAERNLASQPLPSLGDVHGSALASPPAGPAEAADAAPPTTTLDVAVHLGDVEILRGQQLALHLGGDLRAKVGAATVVRGTIHLKSGKLNVQSKEFTVEKGTVSFVGDDPANPEVNVTAGWTAPDGTSVHVDYVGPVKTGKVSFRSEPPRPKNEILALILFGTADGSSATPYASKSPGTDTQVGTTVGGLATDGLSKGLDQITGMNVTTKIDTSDSANPRPEVELQIAKDISLELAFVLGTPPPGTNPDTSYATVNWRFVRNWSLETTFGDYGSTFADIVWKHRY